jgi:ligand-binding sensor domain-containing protein
MSKLKIYKDKDGDLWVETMPGRLRIAQSRKHAERIANSGQGGTAQSTVERLHGPLREA